jgi:SAM-dependent methyltransferase
MNEEVAQLRAEVERLQELNRQQKAKSKKLREKLDAARAELQQLQNSWPGKVNRLVRKLGKHVRGGRAADRIKIPAELIPPAELLYAGGAEGFVKVGRDAVRHMIELGGLRPQHRVLEPGCGIGRIAAALTQYLNKRGSYDGFDIINERVEWCAQNITPRYPNFRFALVDLFNKTYNPGGKLMADSFRFPHPDGAFDFVFLTSVFTHMLPADMEHYLSEMARVMKPKATSLITFFLLNKEGKRVIDERTGKSSRNFAHDEGVYRIEDRDKPEAAVAYEEGFVRDLFEKHGFGLHKPIIYGFQDIVVIKKIG